MTIRGFIGRLKTAFSSDDSLGSQILTSGIWLGLLNATDRFLQLAKTLIIASILTPAEFGLMGIALLTLAVLTQFSKLGLSSALIQRAEANVDDYLDTVFSLQLGRGLLLATIGFLIAPLSASFFGEPRVTTIIRVISVTPLIRAFKNPALLYLEKDFQFDKKFVYEVSTTFVSSLAAVIVVLITKSVWALVVGAVAQSLLRTGASYIVHDYRPSLSFRVDQAKEVLGYGKWLTASGIILFLITQGDDAFLGWYVGAAALGIYQLSYRLSNAPATEITHVISGVFFPGFSAAQTDPEVVKSLYENVVLFVSLLAMPMGVGIMLVAQPFATLFLSDQWTGVALMLQVLAVFGVLRAIGGTGGPLFQALGRPDIPTKFQLLNLFIIVVTIYPLTEAFGAIGVALSVTLNAIITVPVNLYLGARLAGSKFRTVSRLLFFPFVCVVLMGIVVLFAQSLLVMGAAVDFVISIVIGIVVYLASIATLEKWFGFGIGEQMELVKNAV